MTIHTVDGAVAVLDEKHYQEHIVSRHPELEGRLNLVVETLQNAEAVYRSKWDADTNIYVKEYTDITIGNIKIERIPLRVYVRGKDGFIVTAYFVAGKWRSLGEKIWPL